jgi:uncharacterized protein YlxP (DUF503 family)
VAFVCLIRIDLHFPENGSLKGKRKELQSLKAQLQWRFGAAVAETDHHDLWKRSELSAALVAREAGSVAGAADGLERWVVGRYPEGARVESTILSDADLTGS